MDFWEEERIEPPEIKKTLLITGSSGYLGWHLGYHAIEQFEVYAAYRNHRRDVPAGRPVMLDIASSDEVNRLISDLRPDAIIHAAAVNPGQGDEELMMQVNAGGSRNVAQAAAAVKARLVHISTDVVHDGKYAPYADDTPPTPLNGYGRSKAAAEAAVQEEYPQAAIVRTSLVYGLKAMDRGTTGFVKRLESGQPVVLFNDVIRQPVWVDMLAAALLKLVNLDYAGLLNVAGRQALTREEFAHKMLAWWQIDPQDRLQSGRAADMSQTIPLDLRLIVDKAEQLFQMPLLGVDEVLARHT